MYTEIYYEIIKRMKEKGIPIEERIDPNFGDYGAKCLYLNGCKTPSLLFTFPGDTEEDMYKYVVINCFYRGLLLGVLGNNGWISEEGKEFQNELHKIISKINNL